MTPDEIDFNLNELENRLERLRALYEQYFLGMERLEPAVPRKDVERRFQLMRREKLRNTARRFKFQMLVQRYNTLQQYWSRTCREIENGTYRRHKLRAERTFGENAPRPALASSDPPALAETASSATRSAEDDLKALLASDFDPAAELDALFGAFMDGPTSPPAPARRAPAAAEPTPPAAAPARPPAPARPAAPSAGTPSAAPAPPQRPPAPATGPLPPSPALHASRPAAPPPSSTPRAPTPPSGRAPLPPPRAGGPSLAPQGAAPASHQRSLPARPPPPTRPTPPGAAPAAPTAAPAPPRLPPARPAPPTPAATRPAPPSAPSPAAPQPGAPPPAAARSGASAPGGALDDVRLRSIHERYVAARRQANMPGAVDLAKLGENLRATEAKLRATHQGRAVDFDVVIKDGKAVIKPKLR